MSSFVSVGCAQAVLGARQRGATDISHERPTTVIETARPMEAAYADAPVMASAGLVVSFEDDSRSTCCWRSFVPAVVYLADPVGTQTEAVVIRGISVGVPVRHVVARELTSGLIIGVLIAAAFFPFAHLVWATGGWRPPSR
jgi:hypothetical protein